MLPRLRHSCLRLIAGAAVLGPIARSIAAVPEDELTITSSIADGKDRGGPTASGSSVELGVSALHRFGAPGAWRWAPGLDFSQYTFARNQDLPRRLESYALLLAIDRFRGDESVANLTLRPGFYSDGGIKSDSFDIPIEFTTGVPLGGSLDGVLGFYNSHFYHHPIPAIGTVWSVNKDWRLELIYPEPAATYTPNESWTFRLGCRLGGGGFLTSTAAGRTPLEYSTYRIGVEATRKGPRAGSKITLGVGVELQRTFDLFRLHERHESNSFGYMSLQIEFRSSATNGRKNPAGGDVSGSHAHGYRWRASSANTFV